ncbi:MAG TPA: ribbon-helix-helix protein, CopG family [Thermoplasmata archaeon]|nr:ribbon-helix-helix protein, CopG family [Thermoplasmata archaeon]
MSVKRKWGRPRGTKHFERQVSVSLPLDSLDMIEERQAREKTTFSEAMRRCLLEYRETKTQLESGAILVVLSRRDREELRGLVENGFVTSETYAGVEAIRRYFEWIRKEREERQKASRIL